MAPRGFTTWLTRPVSDSLFKTYGAAGRKCHLSSVFTTVFSVSNDSRTIVFPCRNHGRPWYKCRAFPPTVGQLYDCCLESGNAATREDVAAMYARYKRRLGWRDSTVFPNQPNAPVYARHHASTEAEDEEPQKLRQRFPCGGPL